MPKELPVHPMEKMPGFLFRADIRCWQIVSIPFNGETTDEKYPFIEKEDYFCCIVVLIAPVYCVDASASLIAKRAALSMQTPVKILLKYPKEHSQIFVHDWSVGGNQSQLWWRQR